MNRFAADFEKIKMEYVTNRLLTYKDLAEKYDVPVSTLSRRGQREGWQILREKQKEKVFRRCMDRAAEKLAERQGDQMVRLSDLADSILFKIETALDAIPVLDIDKQARQIRDITLAIRNLKDIQGAKPDADRREQEARIANLEKQSHQDSESAKVEVTFVGIPGEDDWSE